MYLQLRKLKQEGKHYSELEKQPHPDDFLNQAYDFPDELKDVYKLNEAEAREELSHLRERMRLMWTFWKVKEVTLKQKYEDRIFEQNHKLSNNSMLWEQLAEAEKREQVLRKELVFTQ